MRRSKALEAAGYDAGSSTMRLRFRHGGLYDYVAVPPEVYAGLTASLHPWTEWGEHIRSTYDFRRLE